MLVTSKKFFSGKLQAQKKRLSEIMDSLHAVSFVSPDVLSLCEDIKKNIAMSESLLNISGYMDNELKSNDLKIASSITQLEQLLNNARIAKQMSGGQEHK